MKHTASAIALFFAVCANAQWTVVNLHPAGARDSYANGVHSGQQVGLALVGGIWRASLWSGTAALWTDLHPAGAAQSIAWGVHSGQQVGSADWGGGGVYRASLWSGTAGSWVDLHPAGAVLSEAYGVDGGQQVGYARVGDGNHHASLWSGTAGSWLDLNPAGADRSHAYDVDSGQQVGYARVGGVPRASLWSGSAGSWVDLSPAGSTWSQAYGVHGGHQVGEARVDGVLRASLWSGTAGSWVSLDPAGSIASSAGAVDGDQQVGYSYVSNSPRASLWCGTAGSWVHLHAFLPAGFTFSFAEDIWHDGAFTYVVGYGRNNTTGRYEALMWVSRASAPASYNMFRGSVISGNLASLQTSDNNRLVMSPGAVFSNAEPPIQIILNATAPTSSPSGFSFSLESNASIANAEQKISLYNYATGQYEVLDTRLATASDDTVNVNVTSNTSRFIQAGTLAIRARVSYRALGSTFLYPWLGRIDKAWWTFPG